ncbi:MAG: hypothetical protein M2R45_00413 [Verrucomicrobia subdivision 3 bacterium]|nr:hypothetical protein [Limisphaerales bacterium]MCS1413708.1 hypothetical protein [Limisphaerales bacterium]
MMLSSFVERPRLVVVIRHFRGVTSWFSVDYQYFPEWSRSLVNKLAL